MGPSAIMVVEDESVVAMELEEKLKTMGYDVAALVTSGEEAVKKAAEHRPDLVLMDIKLAGHIDGIEAANRIRERYGTPVVFLTAYADETTLERAKWTEPFGYLVKPFSEQELRATIEISLHKSGRDRKVRESAEWFSTTVGMMGGAVIVADQEGKIIDVNPIAETLTEWDKADALGRRLSEVHIVKDPETGRIVEDPVPLPLRPGFVSAPTNFVLISRHGTETQIENRVFPIETPKGNLIGIILAFRDITQDEAMDQDWFSYAANLRLAAAQSLEREEYSEAESFYKRALAILEKNLGGDHPQVADVLERLAGIYTTASKGEEARKLEDRAARIRSDQ